MPKLFPIACTLALTFFASFSNPSFAQEAEEKKKAAKNTKKNPKKAKEKAPVLQITAPFASLNQAEVHEDFPTMCLGADGKPVIAYIENNGEADSLKLAGLDENDALAEFATISGSSADNIYQPCVTQVVNGQSMVVWSELGKFGWDLMARTIERDGKTVGGEIEKLTSDHGNDIFADLGTDRQGRVWLTWQRLKDGVNQVLAKHYDAENGDWSDEIVVTTGKGGGDWEPRLAFGADEGAWIVFDSYRTGNFDVFLTHVSPAGKVAEPISVANSERYEARAEAAASTDGKTLWIVYEDGIKHWGKDLGADWRKKGGGLHHDRQLKLVKVDLESKAVEKIADLTALLPDVIPNPSSVGTGAIDVPEIIVDADGNPWVFFRFTEFNGRSHWQIAFSKLNPATGDWTKAELLGDSQLCLDRRCSVALHSDGTLKIAYPSDLRQSKKAGDTGVYLASIDPKAERKSVGPMPFDLMKEAPSLLKPYNNTPERARDDHHTWEIDGKKLKLVWGDVHRHTDFSSCRTTDDGCITEHYRYAIEAGGLNFLGTSDHTEVGKVMSDYEWWQTQKIADLFHNPGSFVSLYAYEREQKYPYGHRNVLFLERGGPVIYIKRQNYEKSRWATPLPPFEGDKLGEIPPWQLWDLLRKTGMRAATIEHTSAGGMGTDWSKYKNNQLDPEFENVIELFQGSRQSFEGEGAPQPPIVVGGPQVSKFGKNEANGTWQVALGMNHRLGAFASSDHRSTNITYGGVYVSELTREGIFDGLDARRTTAATDKIYLELSCNGKMMGEIFETSKKPKLTVSIQGTAPLSKVTLIRNEQDFHVYQLENGSPNLTAEFTDENPVDGENRYYVRVEQNDGNMGWTSPVWVTVK